MMLTDLIAKLQNIADRYSKCSVQIAHDKDNILDAWNVDRVCFFEDGKQQIAIIVEE